jgi:uncharacterized protein with ACT and thioredoxin-like domain
MTLNCLKGIIMPKCYVCGNEYTAALSQRFHGEQIFLCERHCEMYDELRSIDDPTMLVNYEEHCSIIREMVHKENLVEIHGIKVNVEYMKNIMDSWSEGCLSNLEAMNRILLLSTDVVAKANDLLGGNNGK